MITLQPTNLHWLGVAKADLCAHGGVDFRIGEDILAEPSDSNWSTSAAALFLLRTLSQPHYFAKESKFGQPLIPCCGHAMYEKKGSDDVTMLGCPNGIDLEVARVGDEVTIVATDGRRFQVHAADWKVAVCQFADAVEAFYVASAPKMLGDQDDVDRRGYERFRAEWSRRRLLAAAEM